MNKKVLHARETCRVSFFSIFLSFKFLSSKIGTIQELELLIEVDSILSLEKEKKIDHSFNNVCAKKKSASLNGKERKIKEINCIYITVEL